MDYEKKYKEALERMKIWVSDDTPDEFFDTHEVHTFVFPELAVLEDEKVRKTLIRVLNENVGNGIEKYGAKLEEALTWLEKQGTPYTKRDVDDAFVEGMAFAKNELEKQSEQKPAWSEEDEVRLQACIDCLQAESLMGKVDTVMTTWLKSIKQRIGG